MTWTYSADPTSSNKDAVRYLIGDTNADDPLLQDEEINFNLLEVNNNIYRAAANSCENLAARYATLAQSTSKSVGGLSLSQSYGDRGQRFLTLAKQLVVRARKVNPPLVNADAKALGAEFSVGQFDPYVATTNTWPTDSTTGVTTTYGTGYSPDYSGNEGGGQD
jgi:hypothetical protein